MRANIRRPFDAIRQGIAFVPDDRKLKGLNLKASVGHNMTIANLRRYCRFSQVIMWAPEKRAIEKLIRLLGIKTTSENQNVNSLSGGNQQKVVLAKSLTGSPEVFIFDEPTRGIDVGAKKRDLQVDEVSGKPGEDNHNDIFRDAGNNRNERPRHSPSRRQNTRRVSERRV